MRKQTRQGWRSARKLVWGFLAVLILSSMVVARTDTDLGEWLRTNEPGFYEVVEVNDGDTITVDMNSKIERVRLIGVDTPELHHPQKPVQCFAETARQFVSGLIDNQPVRLEADPEDDNRDLYGRLLRYVYLPDGTLVNTELVKHGYGFAYTYFPFTKLELMRQYEAEARAANRGLWAGCQIQDSDEGRQTNSIL